MTDPIHTEEYKDLTIKIYPDYDSNNDHDEEFTSYENAGWHTYGRLNGYNLFQEEGRSTQWLPHIFDMYNAEIIAKYPSLSFSNYLEDYEDPDYSGAPYDRDKAEALIEKWINNNLEYLPIYVYQHSGITMSTGSYACPWDSGHAGYIFASHTEIKKRYMKKKYTKALEATAQAGMKSWIKYLAAICEGSIYGYTIENKDGEQLESCWGFVETEYPIEKTYVYQEAMEGAKHLWRHL